MTALLSSSGFAATRTWTGTTSANWSVASNWGGTAPVAGDDLVFPASGLNQTTNNDLPAGTAFNSLSFTGGTYTLNGNLVALGAGGITASGGTTHSIDLPLQLTASQTWSGSGGGTVAIIGPLNLEGFALTLSAPLSDFPFVGVVSGPGSITSTFETGLLFEGANTATAPITTNGGLVAFFNNSTYPGPITSNGINALVVLAKGSSVGDVTVNGPLASFIPGVSASGPPDGTANTKNLTLRNLTLYGAEINSPTDFGQTSVTGTVNITGAVLGIESSTTIPAGTQFMIIRNDGTDPVIGTFAGSPQGGTVTSVVGGPQAYTIDYHGGDGNDVVITAQASPTVDTNTALSTTPPSVGEPVTLTATVTPASGTTVPTGTVTFFAIGGVFPTITTSTVLGTATLNGSGVATLTTTLDPQTTDILAIFSGGGGFAGSEDSIAVTLAGSIPTLDPRVLVLLAVALAAIGAFGLKK